MRRSVLLLACIGLLLLALTSICGGCESKVEKEPTVQHPISEVKAKGICVLPEVPSNLPDDGDALYTDPESVTCP